MIKDRYCLRISWKIVHRSSWCRTEVTRLDNEGFMCRYVWIFLGGILCLLYNLSWLIEPQCQVGSFSWGVPGTAGGELAHQTAAWLCFVLPQAWDRISHMNTWWAGCSCVGSVAPEGSFFIPNQMSSSLASRWPEQSQGGSGFRRTFLEAKSSGCAQIAFCTK